jgi:hypothetical protein
MVRSTVCFGGTRGCVGDEDVVYNPPRGIVCTMVYEREWRVWLRCVEYLCNRFVQQQHHILQYLTRHPS